MQADEPQSRSGSRPGSSRPSGAGALAGRGPRLPLWLLTLGAGLVAGLLSWWGGEATSNTFKVADEMVYTPEYRRVGGYEKMELKSTIETAARQVVERKKAAVAFGLLGLALGVSLGLAGGLAAGSSRTTLAGAVVGGLSGAVAGGGLSYALVPLFFRYQDPESGILVLFLTHAGVFAGVGAAAGLGLGFGLGNRPALGRALFGGLLGALVGTFAFEAANSLAFPLVRTFEPVPAERIPRLLVHWFVAVSTALIAGLAAGGPRARSVATPLPQ